MGSGCWEGGEGEHSSHRRPHCMTCCHWHAAAQLQLLTHEVPEQQADRRLLMQPMITMQPTVITITARRSCRAYRVHSTCSYPAHKHAG